MTEEVIGSPGPGVRSSCKPPDISTEIGTKILLKSNKYS